MANRYVSRECRSSACIAPIECSPAGPVRAILTGSNGGLKAINGCGRRDDKRGEVEGCRTVCHDSVKRERTPSQRQRRARGLVQFRGNFRGPTCPEEIRKSHLP